MDLLPLEFAKLERQLASGPAPRDSDDFEFYEELRKAERARADELSPPEEEPWEPADRYVDRPIDRTEPPKPREPYEATTGDTSPMGRPVEGDETNPDDNAAGTRDPAQEATVGFATPIAAPVASSPATVADAPAGTVPRPIPPPAPIAAVELPPHAAHRCSDNIAILEPPIRGRHYLAYSFNAQNAGERYIRRMALAGKKL